MVMRRKRTMPESAGPGGSRAAGLAQDELAAVAASLRELAARLERFRDRLADLEAAVQPPSGSTSRSSRARRSPKRSRSS